MFSARFAWDLRPNRLAELVEAKRRAGAPLLDLTESNPTRASIYYPAEEILAALADRRSLVYEPTPAGAPAARAAVAGYYAARGCALDPEHILLTASTSEAYAYLFKLLTNPGDEVLVPRPSYPLFEFLAGLELVRPVAYPLVDHGGWQIDIAALREALTARTRAIVLVHPNNPTGSFVKQDELEALVEICADRQLAILSDEVFADYALAADGRRVATLAGVDQVLTFALSGLSKISGLPQVKLGWIAIGGPSALRQEAAARLELIADTYLSVATPVQHAAPSLLKLSTGIQEQIRRRVRANLHFLRQAAASRPALRLPPVEGGWYATLEVPRTRHEEEWVLELAERQDVLVQPGFFYDFEREAFLIVSLLTEPDVFREGVGRLLEWVE